MGRTQLGFDIGSGSLKIAVLRGGETRVEEVRLPEGLTDETGTVRPSRGLTRFLRRTRKELSLPWGPAALALPPGQAFCRLVTMPPMTTEQLFLNLSYEFSDFIQGEADRYYWDYAVCGPAGEDAAHGIPMMAAAAEKETLAKYARMFARAGIRLKTILPQEMALVQLCQARGGGEDELCFVDLGRRFTRITVVWRDRVQATRQISLGGRDIEAAASPSAPAEVCERVAVELLKVVNFYQFTHRSSVLNGVYLVGGGAALPALRQSIESTVGLPLLDPSDLLPEAGKRAAAGIFAAGAAMRGK